MSSKLTAGHKYWKTAAMAATVSVGDSPLFLLDYLMRFLRVAVLLAIWRVILAGKGTVSGMTVGRVLTYTLVSEIFSEQLLARTSLSEALWQGTVATRFVRPLGTVGQFAAEMAGQWLTGLCLFSIPLLLCAPLLRVDPKPTGAWAVVLFLPSLMLSISVGLALEFIFGGLTVALRQNVWLVFNLRLAIASLLSGAVLPLALFPWGIGNIFAWLPFASMASAPLRIYTSTGPALQLLLLQAGWSIVLWPLSQWIWRANREQLAGYDG